MNKLRAIIFDMDGTLADTEEVHRQSFNVAFDEFNIPCQWDPSEYKQLLSISGGKERIRHYLETHKLVTCSGAELSKLALSIHRRKSQIYREKLITDHIGPRPGVARLLREAKQEGLLLAIATSSSSANVETLLKSMFGEHALDLFDVVVSCDIVEAKKPSPAVYQFVLNELALTPETCVVIEDTYNGNQAALAAGIKTVITTHAFTIDNDFAGASLVVDQLGELDSPFQVLFGNANNYHYVSVSMLRTIVEQQIEKTEPSVKSAIATN